MALEGVASGDVRGIAAITLYYLRSLKASELCITEIIIIIKGLISFEETKTTVNQAAGGQRLHFTIPVDFFKENLESISSPI